MNPTRLKSCLLAGLFIFLTASIVWQQRIIKQLRAELVALHSQSTEAKQLREENAALNGELKSVEERNAAEHRELLRLRAQSLVLRDKEKEIARLKAESERASQQAQASADPRVNPPALEEAVERRRTIARLNFSKQIGLSMMMFAADNQEQMPPNLEAVNGRYLHRTPEMDEHSIQAEQFEMLYKGRTADAPDPSRTILAREREPMQRTDGQWEQVYVFVDGHAQVLSAPSREQLVQREREQFIVPTNR